MSLVSLLASTTLITLASSTPLTYAVSSQRAKIPVDHDHFLLILLLNRRDSELKPKVVDEAGGVYRTAPELAEALGGSLTRDKRIGSLSIVNSVDVLRQRVLLELARRKAMEDQRQISENRRILDSVGKRSQPPRLYGGRERRKTRLQYHLEGAEARPARAKEEAEELNLVEQ